MILTTEEIAALDNTSSRTGFLTRDEEKFVVGLDRQRNHYSCKNKYLTKPQSDWLIDINRKLLSKGLGARRVA